MENRFRLNDGSQRAPRMEVHHSWWAMRGVGDASGEWSMEQKLERIAEAGYAGILGRLPEESEKGKWRKLLDRYGLSFAVEAFPGDRGSFSSFLREAKPFGVSYVNAQVQDAWVTGQNAVRLLGELLVEAADWQVPVFIETHRGRITQDLLRTVEYVENLPHMRLTIDLSHYVLAGEMLRPDERAERHFDRLLERTSSIHGRISNGEQIQVEFEPDFDEMALTERYLNWWTKGMKYWLKEAVPGDILPFVCELGPIPYALARRGSSSPAEGDYSRWEQGLWFMDLAQEAWRRAALP